MHAACFMLASVVANIWLTKTRVRKSGWGWITLARLLGLKKRDVVQVIERKKRFKYLDLQ